MEIRTLAPDDDDRVTEASYLFDAPAQEAATHRFLTTSGHHLLIAYLDDSPAGFITGIEMTHPDKGTEMFVYELAVDDSHRGQGLASALVEALRDLAKERGCYGMWVLTDEDNEAACASYARTGGTRRATQVMFEWMF